MTTRRPCKQTSTIIVLLGMGLALLAGAGGCGQQQPRLQRFQYAQIKMGVQARLVVYAPDQATAERACTAAYQRVAALEDSMSDYRRDSELLRLCDRAGQGPIHVSDELFFVLQKAQELAEKSDGAFDVTVGPLVGLWRKARKTGQLPTDQELTAARTLVGWRLMTLDPAAKTVALAKPGMRLDLGGIAKGYAGDEAIRILKQNGVHNVLFEAGGDIVVSDPPPDKKGWGIEVENPGGGPSTLHLANCAVSTSGDTVQFVQIGATRYSHVVDPRTGIALTNHYAATIIAARGIDSDGLSTAACVLGPAAGMQVVTEYGAQGSIRQVTP